MKVCCYAFASIAYVVVMEMMDEVKEVNISDDDIFGVLIGVIVFVDDMR